MTPARVLLYYFSGTGNTRLCAALLQKHFIEEGFSCDLYEYRSPNAQVPNPNNYDLLGFGYPIHAFNVPLAFLRFIKKKLPPGSKPYFIFKVSGEPLALNNASSFTLYEALKHKGYTFIKEKHFLMPYNIIFRYPEGASKEMYLYLKTLTQAFVYQLEMASPQKPHYSLGSHLMSFLLRIEWIAPLVNAPLSRIDEKKCCHCYQCLKACPNQAIYLNKRGKLRIKTSCSICMRCTMNCPTNAIHFGFLNHWKVNKPYPYEALAKDPTIPLFNFTQKHRGFFKPFRKYYLKQEELLSNYSLDWKKDN